MRFVFYIILLANFVLCFSQIEQVRSGDFLVEKGYYKEASILYIEYLNTYPKDDRVQLKLAKCYLSLFDEDSAEKPLLRAFSLSKRVTYDMYFTRGRYYQFKHKYSLALKDFEKVPFSGNPEVNKRVAECKRGIKAVKKPVEVELVNLGKPINSAKNEVLPQITADGKQLFFSSYREGALGGMKHPMDVYFVEKANDEWGEVIQFQAPVNSDYNEACVGVSADGHQMYLYRGTNGGDLFISKFRKGRWQEPTAFPFNTKAKESSMTISPDGRQLLFIRKQKGYRGTLYTSELSEDSTWSEPVRFVLDTPYDEETPFFHADGKTLFFSSKGNSTIGGYDVFYSEKTNDVWSKPENVGYPLNTSKDELGFVLSADGKTAYYSSLREGGKGEQDIYQILLEDDFFDSQMVLLSGVVTDEEGAFIEADLVIIDLETQEKVTTIYSGEKKGHYLLPLKQGQEYGIRVEKEGFLFYSTHVFIPQKSAYNQIVHDVVLSKKNTGVKVILNNVFFTSGSVELDDRSVEELMTLVHLLSKDPNLRIMIYGHTDNVGSLTKNQLLSQQRANQVKLFLMSKGIDDSRVMAKGLGDSEPITSNKTKEGRARNRRIVFELFEQ
jgi:outer membrane protein OmpA-like peptidoglycan-associated protein/Tol biopolymer transport system component